MKETWTWFWSLDINRSDSLGYLGLDGGGDNIKMDRKRICCEGVDCLVWLKIGSSGGIWWDWYEPLEFYK